MYTIICFINLFLVFFCNIFKGFEMINIFKIITYLQNIISIPHISSYLKSDMVPKDEPHRDNFNKISFFNKNLFFFFFYFIYSITRIGDIRYTMILNRKRDFKK